MGQANHYKAPFDYAVGRELRRLRQAAGLTQEQAAARAGVARGTYANWECGDSGMTLHTAVKTAVALRANLLDLITPEACDLALAETPKVAGRKPR